MTGRRADGGGLSIWQPVHLGTDETGRPVRVDLAERNLLIGGEPGAGKSIALNLIVGHAALSLDCRLVLVDGKRVELGPWADCAEQFVGPDIDQANKVLSGLRAEMDDRYERLLAWPAAEDRAAGRDLVARGRAAGVIVVAATQRPSADIVPTSLRDLLPVGVPLFHRRLV